MAKKVRITCAQCGIEFLKPYPNNPEITTCDECPPIARPGGRANRERGHPEYDMALELVTMRLAFEMMEPLIKMGRRKEAAEIHADAQKTLDLLKSVEAPGKRNPPNTKS